MGNIFITISREFGSGGRMVGQRIAKELGIPFYDKELIELAAKKSGLSPDFIQNTEEKVSSSFIFSIGTSGGAMFNNYLMQNDLPLSDKAFFAQANVIRDLAKEGSCVIVGRCAGYILRDEPGLINVFLHAGLDSRLERAVKDYGMQQKGLGDKLVRIDKARSNYHKYYTGDRWDDLRLYDLCIDTATAGIDGSVELIESFARRKMAD